MTSWDDFDDDLTVPVRPPTEPIDDFDDDLTVPIEPKPPVDDFDDELTMPVTGTAVDNASAAASIYSGTGNASGVPKLPRPNPAPSPSLREPQPWTPPARPTSPRAAVEARSRSRWAVVAVVLLFFLVTAVVALVVFTGGGEEELDETSIAVTQSIE